MPQSILIIEDDEHLRGSITTSLEDAGFKVHGAAEAGVAMDLFVHLAPDLVLLDLGISGDEGMRLLDDMKMTRPSTPVIIVSGRTHITYAIDAFKSGAFDYVTKPILSMDVFINGLRNCLQQSSLRRRIHDTQEHLFRLVQKLPVIIFIINRDLEFEFLNQASTQILGYAPQEILESPRSFLKRVVREDRGRFMLALKKSLQPEAAEFHFEFRFLHKKGYPVSLMVQSIAPPLMPGSAPDRIEGMIMDMTRNSYLDKLLLQNEKLNMLRIMTEEVAHEIRNPLVSLGGFVRQLHNRYPETVETKVILEECNRLERLLQRITAYLEPMNVTLTCCLLPPTVNFIMRLVSSRLEHKSISCDIELEDDLPPVLADQEFLHRIFIYLIGHGADIVEQSGSIRITASEATGLVMVSLSMEPVHTTVTGHERLIMPFEDDEMNLAMCLRLVERIGGHLHMERKDSWARLTISMPRCVAFPEDKNLEPADENHGFF
jgi:PAS domain S-box-containing protein